jgi:hypothetical protein
MSLSVLSSTPLSSLETARRLRAVAFELGELAVATEAREILPRLSQLQSQLRNTASSIESALATF